MIAGVMDHGGLAESIALRLAGVRERIATTARAAGRDPADVRLVAVSKFQSLERILAAHVAGQLEFGESRAQELDAKLAAMPPVPLRWHFVGGLQRNKVRLVAGRVELIHSVDRVPLIEAIARHMQAGGGSQDVLIQVNVTGERRKGGCAPDEIERLAEEISVHEGVRAVGLMAIPPLDIDPVPVFTRLAALREQLAAAHPGLVELSMGMSADFEAAITCGATIVRVGTDVFGPRPRHP